MQTQTLFAIALIVILEAAAVHWRRRRKQRANPGNETAGNGGGSGRNPRNPTDQR